MSRIQPMIIAAPIPEASGIVIAKNPQISIRIPQIMFPLPAPAAEVESFITFSPFRCDRPQPVDRLLLANTCCRQRDNRHSFVQTNNHLKRRAEAHTCMRRSDSIQGVTVTRKNVAGIDVPLSLRFCLVNSSSNSFCSSAALPFLSAASNAFMVGP
jgi:hypothetical protein